MKESTKKALIELAKALASAILGFLTALLTSSCGSTTKALVKNPILQLRFLQLSKSDHIVNPVYFYVPYCRFPTHRELLQFL